MMLRSIARSCSLGLALSLLACTGRPTNADGGDAGSDASFADGPSTSVTINEIRATDEDWIELYNTGTSAVDLSNWGVTDSESNGAPKLSDLARFPAGTMLGPGEFVVVLVDQADAGVGPQMRCLADGGPMQCFHGSFGISASRGENVHLIAPSGGVSETANYPVNAAATGESWGRLPTGSGRFARNRLTPGGPNLPP